MHANGIWRDLSLDDKGELQLLADGPQNRGGVSFTIPFHERNRGKGAALRTGFSHVSGEVIIIQDADLEYDPNDWSRMLPLIADRKVADVVYGFTVLWSTTPLALFSSLSWQSLHFFYIQLAM